MDNIFFNVYKFTIDMANALSENGSYPKNELGIALLNKVRDYLKKEALVIEPDTLSKIISLSLDNVYGYGPIQHLLDDNSVNDIMINGFDYCYVERSGKLIREQSFFLDEHHLLVCVRKLLSNSGRVIDETIPMVDARLKDGTRINVVIPPISLRGTSLSIRKASHGQISFKQLIEFGSCTEKMAKFLVFAVQKRCNIIVSGGTGSGKTTLLRALSSYIPDEQRLVTIEDAAELSLKNSDIVELETRNHSIDSSVKITAKDLVINALRMRPDRIIIGECRGEETFQMLQAMNTGHDGSMSTLHANSPRDALNRIESMVMMAKYDLPILTVKQMITSAVDIIVQVNRDYDGKRRITDIMQIVGYDDGRYLTNDVFGYKNGEFISNSISSTEKLAN